MSEEPKGTAELQAQIAQEFRNMKSSPGLEIGLRPELGTFELCDTHYDASRTEAQKHCAVCKLQVRIEALELENDANKFRAEIAGKRNIELESGKLVLMERDEKYCNTISGLQAENIELQTENERLKARIEALEKAAQAYLSAPDYDNAEEAIELEALLENNDE